MAEVPRRIEQSGLPTALLWHPLLGSDFEDRLVRSGPIYCTVFKVTGQLSDPARIETFQLACILVLAAIFSHVPSPRLKELTQNISILLLRENPNVGAS